MIVELREAVADDLAGVVAVFLDCWRQSYRGVLPDRLVDAMTDESATALWRRSLAASGATVVAVRDDVVLGVTRYALDGSTGLVHSLYVSPDARGLGLGRRLLDRAANDLAAAQATSALLWVFADNAPSIGFYSACGWLPDGVTRIQDEFGEPEIQLQKVLV
ncbi:MAG: GNAT family N-acetyltransferase [Propionibacteriaceae bacterium]